MRKSMLFICALVALIVTACQPIQPAASAAPASPEGTPLVGTEWVLTTLWGEPALADVTVTALFDTEGRVSGSGGCNNYSTTYTVDGSSLTIDPQMISTLMACPEPIMNNEGSYFQALSSVTTYAIDGETLTLSGSNDVELAVFAAQSQGLAGTDWLVTGYNNGKMAVVSPLPDTELTMSFFDDGTISGSAGCNTYNGSFKTDGENIEIGALATTRMACPEPAMEQETQFLASLQSAATYSWNGKVLDLRTADDAMAVNAIPAQ